MQRTYLSRLLSPFGLDPSGHLLDVHFSRPFYKHMLGLPVSFTDLEGTDPAVYKVVMIRVGWSELEEGDGRWTGVDWVGGGDGAKQLQIL